MKKTETSHTLSKIEKVRKITAGIRHLDKKARQKHPALKRQNLIGAVIFAASISIMIFSTVLYVEGMLPAVGVIFINALTASILHELEHDLIHNLYFKDRWQHRLMMWGVWIFRGNTPSPFFRQKIHLHHHRESGQNSDYEERMIGNGLPWGLKRIIVMLDQVWSFLLQGRGIIPKTPFSHTESFLSSLPVMAAFYFLWHSFLLLFGLSVFGYLPEQLTGIYETLTTVAVCYLIPNVLRQSSIQIISSNMHYFGNVTPGKEGLIEQTQVLNHWLLSPLQLFCFNFGSTHGIHHFVTNQPFYIRQMISKKAHLFMRAYGVQFNDFESIKQSNRFRESGV